MEIRRSRTAYCARCYPGWFRGQVRDRIEHERMFRRGQRVLVAVSGGKDSLALWHTLQRLGYESDGMYIRLGIGDYSRRSQAKTEAFAGRHGLRLHQVDLKDADGFTVPDLLDQRSGKPCSACGTVKRYHFNRVASDLGYDVVATGHNLDDEAATLFGNVVHWNVDYLGRQGPVLEGSASGLVRKVKPLYRLSERETAAYAIIERIDYILEECPMAKGAKSLAYKELLNGLEEQQPGTKHRFLVGYLKGGRAAVSASGFDGTRDLHPCARCGQPTTGVTCAYCRMAERGRRKALAKAAKYGGV
ncbi:MAG: adenine nucleotide alpha hydrolase family protein [Candidatus Dormibacteraeota bacterium]|nr:adenine nucleotide alpha hydrolase family protein [Candidatus Dormibacteraeota bacterium]